ncbi:hypothetical protein PGT21_012601 [Puccinia graminis f. sp. tritici]|nr:hypothetical protein PGT21_012601 [Puccinia graminis f. sp. tritici]KAA1089947.1 hypothetical protein PGTUg99_031031 [Puccinia graminis f. sp. tritici]
MAFANFHAHYGLLGRAEFRRNRAVTISDGVPESGCSGIGRTGKVNNSDPSDSCGSAPSPYDELQTSHLGEV